MFDLTISLVNRLASSNLVKDGVIDWAAPVPAFGNLQHSRVATLGINPSDKEFTNDSGQELTGTDRRFHTLSSLRLNDWSEADSRHISLIEKSCKEYFQRNPYDRWFKRLEAIISGSGASFYNRRASACHLDIIPYATSQKWTNLKNRQRMNLYKASWDCLGIMIRDSPVEVLVLNGRSVVTAFESYSGYTLVQTEHPEWSLPRKNRPDIMGLSYEGTLQTCGGILLGKEVKILGFNHNIQSSFGVTRKVVQELHKWVSRKS